MANNNRQYRRKMHDRVDSVFSSFFSEFKKVVIILVSILIVFVLFYFLTVYLLERDTTTTTDDSTPTEAVIQYQKILAGNSFSKEDDHYYVLYYDMSDEQLRSSYTSLVSNYESLDEHLPIYTVDMSSRFNQNYVSDTSNPEVSSIDELKISQPTLIEITNGEVTEYVENETQIQIRLM